MNKGIPYAEALAAYRTQAERPLNQTDTDFKALLRQYRSELYALGKGGGRGLSAVKDQVEGSLRRIMSRTERMRVANAADGMLREVPVRDVELLAGDVRAFTQLQRVAREVGQPEVVEYWKSAPYLLNFMDNYKLKEAFVQHAEQDGSRGELRRLLGKVPGLQLSWEDIERYQEIDPQNARLRGLLSGLLDGDSWQLLWLPPSAPYYALEGAFARACDRGWCARRRPIAAPDRASFPRARTRRRRRSGRWWW